MSFLSKLSRDDTPDHELPRHLPFDEAQCQQCSRIVGWALTNEVSATFIDYWFITGRDAFDERDPKWCDACVVPSPIPFHN